MNYTKIYNDLIFSRKLLNRRKKDDKYYENHHIIPKCVGDDCKYNMVLLTAREHYFAHYLEPIVYYNMLALI